MTRESVSSQESLEGRERISRSMGQRVLGRLGIEMATKAKKKKSWGGARAGAGRPKGSGSGPSPNARKNRVAVMLSDTEVDKLGRLAKRKGRPLATLAYELMASALRRAR